MRELVSSARWSDGSIELSPALLLGELLRARTSHFVFEFAGKEVVVRKSELSGLARIARRLPRLSARLTPSALEFSWRDGKGGLLPHCDTTSEAQLARALRIVLTEPPVRQPPGGRWLREVLSGVLEQIAVQ